MGKLSQLSHLINVERLIHSFKTALACIIGVLVIKLGHIESGQWIMITIIVVMCAQISVGGLVMKSYLRLFGTFLGSLIAIVALTTFGDTQLVIYTTISLSSFFFSYLATSREEFIYAGTLGAATTAIIMVGDNPNVQYAAARFFDISIGIIIATVISQFVLPIHARTHLRRAQAKTLRSLKDYYRMCMVYTAEAKKPEDYYSTDESIVKTIIKQRALAKEASREQLGFFFDRNHFIQTLLHEKEILRAINFMQNALSDLDPIRRDLLEMHSLLLFNDMVLACFDVLIDVIEKNHIGENQLEMPTLVQIQQDLEHHQDWYQGRSINIDGLLFSSEALLRNLEGLGNLFRVPVLKVNSPTKNDSV